MILKEAKIMVEENGPTSAAKTRHHKYYFLGKSNKLLIISNIN